MEAGYNEIIVISGIKGILKRKEGRFIVISVGGLDFKAAIPLGTGEKLPAIGQAVELFTYLHLREGGADLYAFLSESERQFFEALISVSGVGPKSALSILGVAPAEQLMATIARGEVELLQGSSGIGRKTAERIVLELKDKVGDRESEGIVELTESDSDILEALISLGYRKDKAKEAVKKIDLKLTTASERLRDALRKIKG
ncbi:MAG: Holliday junction branch migration protein RuvA [Candidatus Colwellbacteria bacterium]|nr:Holliday junction branch migration protein RuvA [Candidatus Colwellbacteria bacterium]